jgi:hypothetical protein
MWEENMINRNRNIKADTSSWLLLIIFAALVLALYFITKWREVGQDPISQALEGRIEGRTVEEYREERAKMLQPTEKEKAREARIQIRDGLFWIRLGQDMQKKAERYRERGRRSDFWDNYYNNIEIRGMRYKEKGEQMVADAKKVLRDLGLIEDRRR